MSKLTSPVGFSELSKPMKALVVGGGIAILCVLLASFGSSSSDDGGPAAEPEPPRFPISPQELGAELKKTLGDIDSFPKGGRFSVEMDGGGITIHYTVPPDTPRLMSSPAEAYSRGLVNHAIKILMARGHNPREKLTLIHGRILEPGGKTPTGEDAFRSLGVAMYSYNEDRIIWKPN